MAAYRHRKVAAYSTQYSEYLYVTISHWLIVSESFYTAIGARGPKSIESRPAPLFLRSRCRTMLDFWSVIGAALQPQSEER
jgi:hypothetical protein